MGVTPVLTKRWLQWPKLRSARERPVLSASTDGRPDIGFLADDDRHFELFATWLYTQWSLPRGESLETRRQALRAQMRVDRLPVALTAYWQGRPAGIVSLRRNDLQSRLRVGPWLSALYVDEAMRGHGIGAALVQATLTLAAWLDHPEVWLFTTDRVRFYERLGWEKDPPLPEERRQVPMPVVFRHKTGI